MLVESVDNSSGTGNELFDGTLKLQRKLEVDAQT